MKILSILSKKSPPPFAFPKGRAILLAMSEREQLEQAIAALEAQRATLGDAVVETALGPLREKLAALTKAEASPLDLQGERKPITIVLADIKGSTDLAERLDIEDWVAMMDRVFKIMEAEIYRFGGEVNQFRGDGLLAFFGAAGVHEDDPERAVLAALAMQDAVQPYARSLAEREDIELRLRVGVNTGEVIVTHVGDRRHYSEGTAMGRAVALAARMESAAEPGSVLVTEHTYRLVRPLFEWESLGEIRVKGIHEPVTVYRPLAVRAVPGKARGIPGIVSPLVGRETEFQRLQAVIGKLRAGEGGIVTLVGEAGLGKSRLVAELQQAAKQAQAAGELAPDICWVEGRCPSYGTAIAYLLWLNVLRALLVTMAPAPPEDSPLALRETLRAYVQSVCPDRADEVFPFLARLLSLPLEERTKSLLKGREGEGFRAGTFRAMEYLIEGTARQYPLVIVCEDLHWADATSLALLEHLLPLAERLPLVFICVLRPEKAHRCWQIREVAARQHSAYHTDVWLTPLSATASGMLINNLLRVEALPELLQERVLSYAEGNPFYVEELIRSLIDTATIVQDARTGRWQALKQAPDFAVPATVHGVLLARIDRLPPGPKRVLQLASVIGRTFAYRVLASIATASPGPALPPVVADTDTLAAHMRVLQQSQMIRQRRQERELTYTFKHQLTQEAAYNSLLERERRVFHRQVAEAVKQLFPGRLGEHAGLLAYHWERAGEPQRAIPHLIRAGELAGWQFANTEALAYLQRARALARDVDLTLAEAESLCQLGQIFCNQGDYEEAKAHLEVALRIYRDFANRTQEGRLLKDLGTVCRRQGEYAGAQTYFEQALKISQEIGNWRDEAILLGIIGNLHKDYGDYAQAKAHLERSLRINRAMRRPWGLAITLGMLGNLYRALGAYAEAESYYEQALRFDRAERNRWGEGIVLTNLGLAMHNQGKDESALDYAQQALGIAQEMRDRAGQGHVLLVLGHALVRLGRLVEAVGAYQESLALRHEWPESWLAVEPLAALARVARAQGDLPTAQRHVEECLDYLDAHPALEGTQEPIRIYLSCYQVLKASQDPRASGILEVAYGLLQERAATIADEVLRRAFLENVVAHREIQALNRKQSPP